MQWAWMVGAVLYFAALLLDILGVVVVPVPLLIAIPAVLLAVNLAVGPTLRDLRGANRRGRS